MTRCIWCLDRIDDPSDVVTLPIRFDTGAIVEMPHHSACADRIQNEFAEPYGGIGGEVGDKTHTGEVESGKE